MAIIRTALASMLLVALLVTGSGCLAVAAAAGAGTGVMYVRGALNATVEGTPRQVVSAGEDALSEMGLSVIESRSDDLEGRITARTAQDRRIRIDVDRQTDSTSKVQIRVGTFGDEELSVSILEKIKERL